MDTPQTASVPADRRASNTVTALVGLTVAIVAIVFVFVFVFETSLLPSHWYAFFKVVHVAGAVLWVGGGLTLTILALRAERASNPVEMALIARQVAFVGERVCPGGRRRAPAGRRRHGPETLHLEPN